MIYDFPWNDHHSMQNSILHQKQLGVKIPTRIRKRISTRYTNRIWSKFQFVQEKYPFLIDDSCWNDHHSMQNSILHTIQPVKKPTQINKRISARYTSRIGWKCQFVQEKSPFWEMTSVEMITIRCRIQFCIWLRPRNEY